MRMTANKRRILEALRSPTDEIDVSEYLLPPYSAADVVLRVGGDVRNTARTLRHMARQGLVESVEVERDQWSEVPKPGVYSRRVMAYWNVETKADDLERNEHWTVYQAEQAEKAMRKFTSL